MLKEYISNMDGSPFPVNFVNSKPDCVFLPCGTTQNTLYMGLIQYLFEKEKVLDCAYNTF